MPLVLVRVDDRLIHGQVVEGWLPVIQAQRILVAADRPANDEFQKGLMRLAVPEEVAVDVLSVADAGVALKTLSGTPERILLLVPGVDEVVRLVDAGAAISEVNVGGLHDAPGRVMIFPHLSLTPGEREQLTALVARGIRVETRALPSDHRRTWAECVNA